MKFNNKRELQNIAFNHSADTDYKDFMKIYRERTKTPFSFLATDTKLSAGDPLRFRTNLFELIKMTLTDKSLTTKLNQMKRRMIWVGKQLKFLGCHIKIL